MPTKLAKRAKELAEDGKIDELSGLADDKVYLFSGNEDQTVDARRWSRPPSASTQLPACRRRTSTLVERRRRPRLPDRDGRHGLRPLTRSLTSATAITTRRRRSLNGSTASPRRSVRQARPASSSFSTNRPSAKASANGLAAEGVVYVPAACESHSRLPRCISRCMAASRRGRPSATPLSRKAALPATPTPTGS